MQSSPWALRQANESAQGVPTAMLMCGDGLAIIKAIMGAAHQFPQRLLATVVIHPPRGLAVAWAVVSKLLPPPVRADGPELPCGGVRACGQPAIDAA